MVDEHGGKAKRMDFYRIAGSEAALNRWIQFFKNKGLLKEEEDDEGSTLYKKTEFGEKFHQMLRDHRAVKIIVTNLSRDRLKP